MSRTVEELEAILGDTSWEFFESRHTGDIFVQVKEGLLGFYMRIGTHFKRPMQVIMADGTFIRMRSADRWGSFLLTEIDPNRPDACLYPSYDPNISGAGLGQFIKPLWQPHNPYTQVASSTTVYATNNTSGWVLGGGSNLFGQPSLFANTYTGGGAGGMSSVTFPATTSSSTTVNIGSSGGGSGGGIVSLFTSILGI